MPRERTRTARDGSHRRASRVAAAALWFFALSAAPAFSASAQSIGLQAGATAQLNVAPNAKFAVPINIDLTNAGAANIASLQTLLSFGQTRITFDSIRVVAATGFSLTPNTANALNGSIVFNAFSATSFAATGTLANVWFTAAATTGGTRVLLAPSAAGNDQATPILNQLAIRNLDVCVAPSALWGDVNADGVVSIIDAQQVARFSVGLSVANLNAINGRGDVNADAIVNIIDAQQIARFSVSLSAAARVNTAVLAPPAVATVSLAPGAAQAIAIGDTMTFAPTIRDAGAADIRGCATVTWTSNNPTVASVSNEGFVKGLADGIATITANAGGQQASVQVTVGTGAPSGIMLSVTSPVAAKRYFVVVDSGAVGPSPQGIEVAAPSPNSRAMSVPLNLVAGANYRVRVLVTDSLGTTAAANDPQVAAGGRARGITVTAGSMTPVLITATAVTVNVTSAPTTLAVGAKAGIAWTLHDPSLLMKATGNCSALWYTAAAITSDSDIPGGALSHTACSAMVTGAGDSVYTFTDTIPSPAGAQTVNYQIANRWMAFVGAIAPTLWTPSLQRGQSASTIVWSAAGTVTVQLTASTLSGNATTSANAIVRDASNNVVATTVTWTSSNPMIARVAGDGTVQALGTGTTNITATAGSLSGFATLTVNAVASGFSIVVRPIGTMSPTVLAAFTTAAARWAQVIRGSLTPVTFPNFDVSDCLDQPANTTVLNETIQNVVIYARVDSIDGPGAILGSAGPCYIRNGSSLPILGSMHFDSADMSGLIANNQLNAVILHEMGHVLGIGTLWTNVGLLQDPAPANPDPIFTGVNGRWAFANLGVTYAGRTVPVENCCGAGTQNGHWRESVLARELMTGFISAAGQPNPLSPLTAASLIDMGYTVDVSQSDAQPWFLAVPLAPGEAPSIELREGPPPLAVPVALDPGGRPVPPPSVRKSP